MGFPEESYHQKQMQSFTNDSKKSDSQKVNFSEFMRSKNDEDAYDQEKSYDNEKNIFSENTNPEQDTLTYETYDDILYKKSLKNKIESTF